MLPEFCSVRLLVEPDENQFDNDDYRVHKGATGIVVSAQAGENGGPNRYIVDFTDPDTTDGISCSLLHLLEHELEPVQ